MDAKDMLFRDALETAIECKKENIKLKKVLKAILIVDAFMLSFILALIIMGA